MKKENKKKKKGEDGKKGFEKWKIKEGERELSETELVRRVSKALKRGREGREIYQKLKEINRINREKKGEWEARALGWKIISEATNNRWNSLEKIIKLIIQGADFEAKDRQDRNALMMAVWQDNVEIARLLLELGCWIESKDKYGCTPLMWASRSGRKKAVEFLVEHGANLFSRNKEWKYAEDLTEDEEIKKFLIGKKMEKIEEYAKKSGNRLIIEAIKAGDEKMLKILIEKGEDVDARDIEGNPALAVAARMFNSNLAKMLLDAGANVNAVDRNGNYPDQVALNPFVRELIFKKRLGDLIG